MTNGEELTNCRCGVNAASLCERGYSQPLQVLPLPVWDDALTQIIHINKFMSSITSTTFDASSQPLSQDIFNKANAKHIWISAWHNCSENLLEHFGNAQNPHSLQLTPITLHFETDCSACYFSGGKYLIKIWVDPNNPDETIKTGALLTNVKT